MPRPPKRVGRLSTGVLLVALTGCGLTAVAPGDLTAPPRSPAAAPSTGPGSPVGATDSAQTPAAQVRTSPPYRVVIPRLGVDSLLENLAVTPNGMLAAPRDFQRAGWFTSGTRPGDVGPAVVAGHVDSRAGPAVFFRLSELRAGDRVTIVRRDGSRVHYDVDRLQRFAKNAFPTEQVYGPTALPELRLITCAGYFDRTTGHYVDNLVVWATQPGRKLF